MKNLPFQQELKIDLPIGENQKSSLALSPTGDLQLVDGKDKLVTQILRAIINDETIGYGLINSMSSKHRVVASWITSALRVFRETQLDEVSRSDSSFSGFNIWRRAADTTDQFSKISKNLVDWKFIDSDVINGTTYEYGVTKNYENSYNTVFVDRFTVVPYRSLAIREDLQIGKSSVVFPGDKEVTFYVDYNRRFKASELLDTLERVQTSVDSTDPRRVLVQILVKNYFGEFVSIASGKVSNG